MSSSSSSSLDVAADTVAVVDADIDGASRFAPLSDWFSFESASVDGRTMSAEGEMTCALLLRRNPYDGFKPTRVCFRKCRLRRALMQFAVGTAFDEIALNDCHVLSLYIHDATERHVFERAGFHYSGTWAFRVHYAHAGVAHVHEFDDVCNAWSRRRVGAVRGGGFLYDECTARVDLGFAAKGAAFERATLDLAHASFTAVANDGGGGGGGGGGGHVGGRLLVRLRLGAESIARAYLDQALREGMIDKHDYDWWQHECRRDRDVALPSAMRATMMVQRRADEQQCDGAISAAANSAQTGSGGGASGTKRVAPCDGGDGEDDDDKDDDDDDVSHVPTEEGVTRTSATTKQSGRKRRAPARTTRKSTT